MLGAKPLKLGLHNRLVHRIWFVHFDVGGRPRGRAPTHPLAFAWLLALIFGGRPRGRAPRYPLAFALFLAQLITIRPYVDDVKHLKIVLYYQS